MKRMMKVLAAAAIMTAALAVPAFAEGWQQTAAGEYWYDYGNGSYATGIQQINGAVYAFDSNGIMRTGWQQDGAYWLYFDPASGARAEGWRQIGDGWYYLQPGSGIMASGFQTIGRKLYYLDPVSGKMQSGAFYVDDYSYMTDASGAVRTSGYEQINEYTKFHFMEDGKIKFTNDSREIYAAAADDSRYRYLYRQEYDQVVQGEEREVVSDYAEELKEELYENYIKRTSGKSGGLLAKKKEQWKEYANRKLAGFMTPENINEYITRVLNGWYSTGYVPEDDDYTNEDGEEEEEEEEYDY